MSRELGRGSCLLPWVRLHCLKNYYRLAALLKNYPEVHLTISLTPVLLWQIEEYLYSGVTDLDLELCLKPSSHLTSMEKEYLRINFFPAFPEYRIFPFPRYRELYQKKIDQQSFTEQDYTDLKMWFNLSWFSPEFRTRGVTLENRSKVSITKWLQKGRNFTAKDLREMIAQQYKIMRNIIPLHRKLQEKGQIEVSVSPYYHPLLPLIYDSASDKIARPAAFPLRFHRPEDAYAQIIQAKEFYQQKFGSPPKGMWPAEGAISPTTIELLSRAGIKWIISDQEVLRQSGDHGYAVDDPQVLGKPYLLTDVVLASPVSIFFRDTQLSQAIASSYPSYQDYHQAVEEFLTLVKKKYSEKENRARDLIVTVVLDSKNTWESYRDDGQEFLHYLYRRLEEEKIKTVTLSEYLEGNPYRDIPAHPPDSHASLTRLFTACWIDEKGSHHETSLGTRMGEPEENRAWELLKMTRDDLEKTGATYHTHSLAFRSMYAAEGSDWFWWYGKKQESRQEYLFDDLFRKHLKNVYLLTGQLSPLVLNPPIVPHGPVWSFNQLLERIPRPLPLTIETAYPGVVHWGINNWQEVKESPLEPVSGGAITSYLFRATLGPFEERVREINFTFRWADGCWEGRDFHLLID